MDDDSGVGKPWPGLVDRLEGAIAAVDSLRDALLGTYDIHMARAAQRANDVMKALTVLSAVLLPAVVVAGVMGMNFPLPFFEDTRNFFIVIAVMVGFAVLVARGRALAPLDLTPAGSSCRRVMRSARPLQPVRRGRDATSSHAPAAPTANARRDADASEGLDREA